MIMDGDIVIYQGSPREVLWAEGRQFTIVITDPWDERIVVPIDRVIKQERSGVNGHTQI